MPRFARFARAATLGFVLAATMAAAAPAHTAHERAVPMAQQLPSCPLPTRDEAAACPVANDPPQPILTAFVGQGWG